MNTYRQDETRHLEVDSNPRPVIKTVWLCCRERTITLVSRVTHRSLDLDRDFPRSLDRLRDLLDRSRDLDRLDRSRDLDRDLRRREEADGELRRLLDLTIKSVKTIKF